MLPLEQNGMAFSPSVAERTPSTAITKDGLAWVDFSVRTRLSDGKHDGGDTLELAARRSGESKAAKSSTMREVARAVMREARDAMESAARVGDEPPSWVASIMTEAGWQRYRFLRAGATRHQRAGLPCLGGSWFYACSDDNTSSARADHTRCDAAS